VNLEARCETLLDARLKPACSAAIVVALSGGGDSVALLAMTVAWARARGRPVLALTVDHGLQPQSAAWSRFATETAAKLGAAHRTLLWTGDKPSTGVSAAARAARHALLADAAREAGASVILMGHTADDRLEADLMRAEGSTLGRLRPWAPSPAWPEGRGVFLLRPLLDVRRATLRRWLAAQRLGWIEDPANADPRSGRARARLAAQGAPDPPPAEASPRSPLLDGTGLTSDGRILVDRAALAGSADARRFAAAALACAAGATLPAKAGRIEALLERLCGDGPVTATLGGARLDADASRVASPATPAKRSGAASRPSGSGRIAASWWDGRFEAAPGDPAVIVLPLRGRAATLPPAQRRALAFLPPPRGSPACCSGRRGRDLMPLAAGSTPGYADPAHGPAAPGGAGRDRQRSVIWGLHGKARPRLLSCFGTNWTTSGRQRDRLDASDETTGLGMNLRSLAIWGVIGMILVALYSVMNPARGAAAGEISYSEVVAKVEGGSIKSANVQGERVRLIDSDNKPFSAIVPPAVQADLIDHMQAADVRVEYQSASPNIFISLIGSLLPILLLIGVWIFFMRQMQGGARGAMGFGKSKAKLLTENKTRVTFDDVAGVEEAKEDLVEIVDFLKDPSEVPEAGRQDPEGRPAGRPSRHRQDAARARGRGRGGRAVLLHLRLRLRGDVRRRRAPAASATCSNRPRRTPLHHLHRRDRRRRPSPRRGHGRRQRRARADPEPAAGRDGRLRVQRRHHPDRRHQPARRAGPRAAASRAASTVRSWCPTPT
jgi:tRNA(Ile)-lysidine synthase